MRPAVFDGGARFADAAHAVDGLLSPDDGGTARGEFFMQTGEESFATDEEFLEGVEGEIADGRDEAGRRADVGDGFLFEQVGDFAEAVGLKGVDFLHEAPEVEFIDIGLGAAGEFGPLSRVSRSVEDEEENG